MKVVVGDNVGVNGGASGEYELAPIGGDDGVAVAGLGEGERWYRAWSEKVENGRECGCAYEYGRSTGVGEKVVGGDGYGCQYPVICIPCCRGAVVDDGAFARTSSRWGSG